MVDPQGCGTCAYAGRDYPDEQRERSACFPPQGCKFRLQAAATHARDSIMRQPHAPLFMLAGLLLAAADMIRLTDETMPKFTEFQSSNNRPAFLMYMPEDCQTEGCKIMLTFWELAGKEMPGLVWLVDCNETSTQVMSLGSNSVHRPSLAHRALRLARLALCLAVLAR